MHPPVLRKILQALINYPHSLDLNSLPRKAIFPNCKDLISDLSSRSRPRSHVWLDSIFIF